jgi:P pilus assembly chaperone PapD
LHVASFTATPILLAVEGGEENQVRSIVMGWRTAGPPAITLSLDQGV